MDSWDNPAYEAALGYQKTAALTAAVKLDIVTSIGGGALTSEVLAEKTATSPRGMRILCDLLTVMGLLRKEDGPYSVTEPAKRYLDPSSPAWMGGSIDFYGSPEILRLVLDDPSVLRKTRWLRRSCASRARPSRLAPVRQSNEFNRAPRCQARSGLSRRAARARDSSGRGGRARFLRHRAGEGVPGSCGDRCGLAERPGAGVRQRQGRWRRRALPQDRGKRVRSGLGRRIRLVILANFLHHFSPDACATILRKVKIKPLPQGRACAVDFVPDEDRAGAPSTPCLPSRCW